MYKKKLKCTAHVQHFALPHGGKIWRRRWSGGRGVCGDWLHGILRRCASECEINEITCRQNRQKIQKRWRWGGPVQTGDQTRPQTPSQTKTKTIREPSQLGLLTVINVDVVRQKKNLLKNRTKHEEHWKHLKPNIIDTFTRGGLGE